MLAGVGVLGEDGMRGLDCVSCVSDGLCVCSFVPLVVLCVFHLLRFVCLSVCLDKESLCLHERARTGASCGIDYQYQY